MIAIIPALRLAGLRASRGTIPLRLRKRKKLIAHISIIPRRGINSATKLLRPAEAGAGRGGGVFVVGVGACDDDLEVGAPLAVVGGFDRADGDAPQSAFEVGGGGGVGAGGGGGVLGGVALEVEVEGGAAGGLVAEGGAGEGVVGG